MTAPEPSSPPMPSTVQIGTVEYAVMADHDSWMRIEHSTQTKGFYGHTHNHSARIYINPDSVPEVQRLTLWHEVLHALVEVTMGAPDFRSLPGGPETKDEAEESVVRMWEHPTLAVLRDNPGLLAYLTA
ncbi:hypothetical protein [Microbacterium sp.]|uniref:hypothetical protein n=1 Tax=Microbacterium sp. TaxID=51671 RepID=UPI003A92E14E